LGGDVLKIYIGIDPGQTGAMAIISEAVKVWDFDDFECIKWLKAISDQIIRGLSQDDVEAKAVIEKVNAMPKQGVSSTFKFGQNFGQWIGRLEALCIPFDYVTPAKWRKEIFDSMPKGDTKAMSLDRARRLFPSMVPMLNRKKDHGRAEALLLAEYCRRMDLWGESRNKC